MGAGVEIENFDKLFATLSTPPIVLNEFDISSDAAREELSLQLYTHYNGTSLSVLPQCRCGRLSGVYLLDRVCPECNVEVHFVTEKELEPILWVAPPTGVSTLIQPQCWTIISRALTYGGLNILEYLCNPNISLPVIQPKEAQRFLQLKIPRGLNYFHEHFDEIIERLFSVNLIFANKPKRAKNEFAMWLERYRDCIFTKHLPCPSKMSLITERTVTSSYAEPTMPLIVNAVLTITNTENSTRPLSIEVKQARATEAIKRFAEYHQEVKKNVLFGKPGWARKQLFGSRLHWTFRGVITSLSENHVRDEIHMPWSMSVMLLQMHLFNKLLALNYTPDEANNLVEDSVLQYNPLIDKLFKELIAESPVGGLPILFGRNPTLVRGSIQLLRITRINTDPKINSIAMSVLILSEPNADFDGDRFCHPSTVTWMRETFLIAGNSRRPHSTLPSAQKLRVKD